jgi:hypothetical protein
MPFSTAGPGHQVRKGGKQLFVFDLNVLDNSSRKVYGIATSPDLDRENEAILKAALEGALPDFMQLPIMHLDHTERPVGWFTKAEFRGQDLYVEACVKPTSDCDEFWDDVVKASRAGKPYQFSIFGDRVECTPSCALHPDDPKRKQEPCITKALVLYSISICQPGTAINPNTFAEVMKALALEKTAEKGLVKATDSASNMIHPTTDGKYPKEVTKTMEPEDEKKVPEAPATEQAAAQGPSGEGSEIKQLLTTIVERLQSLESSIGLNKAEPEDEKKEEDDEKKEVQKSPCAKKAEAVAAQASTFTKAELGRITKAEERIAALETELETLKKSTAKPTNVIVIDPKAAKDGDSQDPTKAPLQKSAGASNASNFEKIYGNR